MPHVLQLRGPRALSEFRLAKLVASLQKLDSGVRSVAAEFRHFVELDAPPAAAERTLLERLLAYGPIPEKAAGDLFLVVPRVGTISPWSSKATDIARNCGLTVRRIERGTVFFIQGSSSDVSSVLHDRMTETVLRSFDAAEKLLEHVPPRPLQSVAVGTLREANRRLGESDALVDELRAKRGVAAHLGDDRPLGP